MCGLEIAGVSGGLATLIDRVPSLAVAATRHLPPAYVGPLPLALVTSAGAPLRTALAGLDERHVTLATVWPPLFGLCVGMF